MSLRQNAASSLDLLELNYIPEGDNDDYRNIPCAHIAAPTRLETVNTKPMTGRPSNKAAVNPKT